MIKTLKDFQGLDADKVARAIEADAGQAIPGLRESLAELKAGKVGAVHTPEAIAARAKGGRPKGSVKENPKVATNIRFDPDVLVALKASGPGWQTRLNELARRQAVAPQAAYVFDTRDTQNLARIKSVKPGHPQMVQMVPDDDFEAAPITAFAFIEVDQGSTWFKVFVPGNELPMQMHLSDVADAYESCAQLRTRRQAAVKA
ncbi:uncharacterized protein (DUF4415 family) [Acidovorax delafieldii]|uniref:Uncharacterized protein (DUF4415 family) n=1 Tax=Acidovorax delafieldii TaxID=47920 RepID=A0AAJ2BXI5_ACIDE|nr:BrnA antitoxin family protein [Acidovorax delafieldii]MDR6767743.1 uncharacterized protein (DUF4415 family) [Acidovorax delafieldii]MDR6839725.1 uncharacterized protein (DUF4415 family) [Acidovorax delafieldii]MDR7368374.1 uncharacterized protein (DUF4415 family) [Acidovorax delafieldii]